MTLGSGEIRRAGFVGGRWVACAWKIEYLPVPPFPRWERAGSGGGDVTPCKGGGGGMLLRSHLA